MVWKVMIVKKPLTDTAVSLPSQRTLLYLYFSTHLFSLSLNPHHTHDTKRTVVSSATILHRRLVKT
jgi:hypothetical protein